MPYKEWLPKAWGGMKDDEIPFLPLRKRIDSLFDDFDMDVFAKSQAVAVRTNVSETDTEVRITAELPGIEEKDVDISVTGDRITIKGEKKSETEEKGEEDGRQFHRMERHAGSFQRVTSLPFDIDPDSVRAEVKDGILTVTIPKPAEEQKKTKKVIITKPK